MTATGRATIVLKDHRVYVCDETTVEGSRVTFKGRLRVRDLSGERYYATRTQTVPLSRVRSVCWHDGSPA